MIPSVVDFAHTMITPFSDKEAIAIDATAGNGHDTAYLAERFKHVFAFDIQKEALMKTKKRCEDKGLGNISLIEDSHENMHHYVQHPVKVIMFNLGYLPGGNKKITTQTDGTLLAIKKAITLLKEGGCISLILYPGHPEGKREATQVEALLSQLSKKAYTVIKYQLLNRSLAPFNIIVEKTKEASLDLK